MATLTSRLIAATLLFSFFVTARAADCPEPKCFDGMVTVVVPFAAGGPTDQVARLWAAGLSRALGQPVVVDNKPGANGAIAMAHVAKAAPDSRTILVTNQGPISITPNLSTRLAVNPARDLVPAVQIAISPQALVARANAPFKDLKELTDYAGKNSGGANYGSPGTGTHGHLLGEQFARNSGTKLRHVPYRGSAPAMADLVGGQIDVMFVELGAALNNKVRVLAVSGERRTALAQDAPTFAELGFRGVESGWIGAFFPAGTDPAIVSRLNTETQKMVRGAEFRAKLQTAGMEAGVLDRTAFAGAVSAESAKWATVIRQSNIKID
jgi:tripartite-type tricarboxylate transporter receptor subunit TctC